MNKKTIKTIFVDRDGFIPLDVFYDLLDTSKVSSYSLKVNKDKTLAIKFYDSKKKLVRPYER